MSQRLNGKNPLSYLGVNPVTPPGFLVNDGVPTPNDSKNFLLGQIWLERNTQNLWMLTSLASGIAVWTPFAGGGIIVQTLQGNTGGPIFPLANNINVVGDNVTIDVVGNPATHTLTISTIGDGVVSSLTGDTGSVVFPTAGNINVQTNGSSGSSIRFTGFAAPTSRLELRVTDSRVNTLIGQGAGNALGSFTGTDNVGLGSPVLDQLSSGSQNVAIGNGAGGEVTTGSRNSSVGWGALAQITTSASNNIGLGYLAGGSLIGNRNSNIMIGNAGQAADDNTIRIGTQGNGAGQVNRFFAAGIDGVNVGSVATVVTEAAGQLGTAVITAGAGVTVTPGANTITIAATGSVPSYTHGTWTPTLSFGGSSVGITYATQLGDYIQIGQLIFVNYQILLTSKGAQVGVALINGFPFTNTGAITQNHVYTALAQNITLDAGYTYIGLAMTGTSANIEEYGSGIPLGQLNNTHFANTSDIAGSFCYSTGVL